MQPCLFFFREGLFKDFNVGSLTKVIETN
uniref:Uncharacterized protein n=1 Tax=Rhizophora mucronata TaxID=61149 RepID=A0A2P2J391_RHIMU